MARKAKGRKEQDNYDKAKFLEKIFREVAEHEVVKEKGAEMYDKLSREEWIEYIDNYRLEVKENLNKQGILEYFGNEYIKPLSGYRIYKLWENSDVTLPMINWGIFLNQIVYPYWENLDYCRKHNDERSRVWIAENSLMNWNIDYRMKMFNGALQRNEPEGVGIWTKKLLLLMLQFRRSIQRHKIYWKKEYEVEVEVEVVRQKKKKTVVVKEKRMIKTQNHINPKWIMRLTKIENMLTEMIRELPLFYLDDKITEKATSELEEFMNLQNTLDTRKAEKEQGRERIDSEKLSHVLDPFFLRDFINSFYIIKFITGKYQNELQKWGFKKFVTIGKHMKAYSDMLLKEVIILTETEEEKLKDFIPTQMKKFTKNRALTAEEKEEEEKGFREFQIKKALNLLK